MTEHSTEQVAREFFSRVSAAAEGTPYAVTPTQDGFSVGLDVVDARWFEMLSQRNLQHTFVHHVAMADGQSYKITDETKTLYWEAGVPRVGAGARMQKGRQIQLGGAKVWQAGPGGIRPVGEFTFDSEEGRQLIKTVGESMGLKSKLPGVAIGAIVVAGIAVIGAIIALILLFAL